MFIRYSCGCVALRFTQPSPPKEVPKQGPTVILLTDCCATGGDDPVIFEPRPGLLREEAHGKTFEPLTPAETAVLIKTVASLVRDGHRGREVGDLLRGLTHVRVGD